MKARFNYYTASPDTMKAMFNSQAVIEATGLEARLILLHAHALSSSPQEWRQQ